MENIRMVSTHGLMFKPWFNGGLMGFYGLTHGFSWDFMVHQKNKETMVVSTHGFPWDLMVVFHGIWLVVLFGIYWES